MNTSDSHHLKGIRLGAALAAASATMMVAAGCGSSGSSTTSSAAGTTTSAASAATSTAGSATSSAGTVDGGASPSTVGSDTGATSLPPKPTTPGPGGPRDCSTDMLSFSIEPLHEPINHVMITARNTSQQPCHLTKYPELSLSASAKTPIGAAEATKPNAVVTLAPGQRAYAGVMTSSADGSGKDGKAVPTLFLALQSSSSDGSGAGRPTSLPMPSSANYIDSSVVVTYWESDQQSATY